VAGFLDQMAAGSRGRAEAARAAEPLARLRARIADLPPPAPLARDGGFDLIAELKLRSPALGTLGGEGDDLAGRVGTYAEAGAAAVSVLTEPTRFAGSLDHLRTAAAVLGPLGVPAMRKDFLVDPYQLYEARAAGAGGALLIVRMLSRGTLGEMLDCARELGLFVLVEAFDEDDIAVAVQVLAQARLPTPGGAPGVERAAPGDVLLGVNSRDLQTLEVVPERLEQLAPQLPRAYPRVAESGLTMPADAARMVRAGYDMALVGGALMSAADPGALVRAMLAAGRAAA
jgi:indole-3-glycerol phosphate synthase